LTKNFAEFRDNLPKLNAPFIIEHLIIEGPIGRTKVFVR
jgi:hypothetical protein